MPVRINDGFAVDDFTMRYSSFVPRLYNYCLSLGMQPNRIVPSRAFCSDENQGYPIILITKNFSAFPFNHGRVGGIVATGRHGPYAQHGKDLVMIHACHVGYEPETEEFGTYRRLQTEGHVHSADCGAICHLLDWYQKEYNFTRRHIVLDRDGSTTTISIDNRLLRENRDEGLFLNLEKLLAAANRGYEPLRQLSTTTMFRASPELVANIGDEWTQGPFPIGEYLNGEMIYFRRKTGAALQASDYIHRNLMESMPTILTSKFPPLLAAKINTRKEFDRTYRTIIDEKAYRGKNLVFISGLHIDVSPRPGQIFPLTKFVPWAAYIQRETGEQFILEQQELYSILQQQSMDNPHKIDLTEAINDMKQEAEIRIRVDDL